MIERQTARQFLLSCLRARWEPSALQAARTLIAQSNLDWEALQHRATSERLAPLLYHIVRDQDLVPRAVEERLRSAYYTNALLIDRLVGEMETILPFLAAIDIPVILLKGASLAETMYGNVALRPMDDIDLLVHEADVPATLCALTEIGYETMHAEVYNGAHLAHENEVMLRKRGTEGVLVEVHWSLFDSPFYQYRLPMEWFWQTALDIQVREVPTRILGPEAQVLYLCGHALLHHGTGGETRLLWLHDVGEVIAHYGERLDWEELLSQARACDLVLPVQRVLIRLSEGWHVPIPPPVLVELRGLKPSRDEERVFRWLTSGRRSVARRTWMDIASMPSWKQRLRYALSALFPSPAYMQRRYRIPRSILLPLYYPYRWFVGLKPRKSPSAAQALSSSPSSTVDGGSER